MDKNKDNQKEKTPAIETFPTDETPTPTKILRLAVSYLFQNLMAGSLNVCRFGYKIKENLRRPSAEVIVAGHGPVPRPQGESVRCSVSARDRYGAARRGQPERLDGRHGHPGRRGDGGGGGRDSQHAADLLFRGGGGGEPGPSRDPAGHSPHQLQVCHATPYNRDLISSLYRSLRPLPTASVQPVKTFKPIAPAMPAAAGPDNAMLLLKFPGGETIKLSNLPFVKAEEGGTATPAVQQETKLKLKRVLSGGAGPSAVACSSRPPLGLAEDEAEEGRSELKERNRMSAQRSRLKKRQQLDMMADTCSAMQRHNSALTAENKVTIGLVVSSQPVHSAQKYYYYFFFFY